MTEYETFQPYVKTLSLRESRKYVDSYRHLDEHRRIGTVTVMQHSAQLTDDNDPCEPTRTILLVNVMVDNSDHSKPLVFNGDIKQALRDTFTAWGCGHEYDCCGCWNTSVTDVVPLRSDENPAQHWIVIQSSIKNY